MRLSIILIFFIKINIAFGIPSITNKIAAVVNNNIILDSDIKNTARIFQYDTSNSKKTTLSKKLDLMNYQDILYQLIQEQLILQFAIQENININQQQVDQKINYINKLNNITFTQLHKYLQNTNLNYEKFYLQIYQEMIKKTACDNIVFQRIYVSQNEINNILQKLIYTVDFNKQFKLIHIIIPLPIQPTHYQINQAKNLAKLLINKRKSNCNIKNFIQTNFKNNIFPIIDLQETEWISYNNIPVIFDQHLKTAQIGDIIGPIHSYDGIHILEIKNVRAQKFIFPVVKVKINKIFANENIQKNADVTEKLLKIKKNIETNQTTFNIINKEQSKDFHFEDEKQIAQWENIDDYEEPMKKALLSLKKNEISIPICTSKGWCIIQLVDINKLGYNEAIIERVYFHLLNQKYSEIIKNWIKELQSISYIKIMN